MTTNIEQEFFKVFEIEKILIYLVRDMGKSHICRKQDLINNKHLFLDKERRRSRRLHVASANKVYPEITDRILLELICIHSYFCGLGLNLSNLWVKNPDELKAIILDEIIRWYKEKNYGYEKCKHQIQKLFKEEE